jgi:hypothetical protein
VRVEDLAQRAVHKAVSVTVGIDAAISGTVGLSADLVDADDNFVAHSFTLQNVATATGVVLRFDGDDIFASRRDGPYTLTNLLFTDQYWGGTCYFCPHCQE